MTAFGLFIALLFGVAAWVDVSGAIHLYRRRKDLGTLTRRESAFSQPPGYLVHVHSSVGTPRLVEEDFLVSVAAPQGMDFEVRVRLPVGVRLGALAGYSPRLSQSVTNRYFSFRRHPRGLPWARATREQVAAELSGLGPLYGSATLEAKNGRLVYAWTRLEDVGQPSAESTAAAAAGHLSRIAEVLSAS